MNHLVKIFWLALLFLLQNQGVAQEVRVLDSTQIATIDSLLIDRNPANYSLRVFGNFKNQSFWFKDGARQVKYVPNNRAGIGFGVASSKLLIDIAFNIKGGEENPTKRFDMRANFKPNHNYFEFLFQRYKGFNEDLPDGTSSFRSDVVSVTTGFNYLYLFNEKDYQVSPLRTVISQGFGTAFSYGAGGFAMLYDQKGVAPVVGPNIFSGRESKGIESVFGIGAGVLVGLGGYFSLGSNLYASVTANGGLGLMHKEVEAPGGQSYNPDALLYQLNGSGVMGYVRESYYINLTLEIGYYSLEVSPSITEILNVAQAKVAVGFNIFREKENRPNP